MKRIHMSTAAFVLAAIAGISAVMQQPPGGFSVLDANGRPFMIGKLQPVPYKLGTEPTVFWNLDQAKAVRDKNSQVISSFGFYGWKEGTSIRVAVIARLAPQGAENRFYSWSELNKSGLKPRLELFATYSLTPGETRVIEELKTVGAESASLRAE